MSPHCFNVSSFQGKFFSLKGQWHFSIITTVDDCIFHGIYWFPHSPRVWLLVQIPVTIGNSTPSLLILTILRVAEVAAIDKEASPNENAKRTAIHLRLLVPRGRLTRGRVPQMLRYIPHPPISGDAKKILPLMGDTILPLKTVKSLPFSLIMVNDPIFF